MPSVPWMDAPNFLSSTDRRLPVAETSDGSSWQARHVALSGAGGAGGLARCASTTDPVSIRTAPHRPVAAPRRWEAVIRISAAAYFFRLSMYATSASSSSFGKLGYARIAG